MTDHERLDAWIDDHFDEEVRFLLALVRVPRLAPYGMNWLWAYWGNPLATNLPVTATNGAVWSGGFDLVWQGEPRRPAFSSNDRGTMRGGTTDQGGSTRPHSRRMGPDSGPG